MFPYLPEARQEELKRLAQQYGQPLVHTVDLGTSNNFDPLDKSDRYGEVCMVVRRPSGHLLTMKKTYYPPNAFRLLTGGIHHGESVFDALLRETAEETGLETEIRQFLAAVAYRTTTTGDRPAFYTFAFLLDETGGTLGVIDEDEQVEDFLEIKPSSLPELAEYLDQLGNQYSPEIGTPWSDWGHFRSIIHRVVWEALQRGRGHSGCPGGS